MQYIYRGIIFLVTLSIFACLYASQYFIDMSPEYFSQTPKTSPLDFLAFIWLIAFPISVCLWLGWVFFLQHVPWKIKIKPNGIAGQLIIRFVTRGINVEAIELSIQTAIDLTKQAGLQDQVRVQVVSDRMLHLPHPVELLLVPPDFETPNHSQFKAKALYYAQTQCQLNADQWILYLDEESRLTESALTAIADFIKEHGQKAKPPIGQGPIVYTGGHWFWRGADALRLADDLGRFKLQYSLGIPIFGVHGSYLLLRGDVDSTLSFDVDQNNSLTEDAAWALLAWQKGYRFAWINGYILEQPPENLKDFLKQRQRWLCGMKLVIKSNRIKRRYKIFVSIYTYLWQLSFLTICFSAYMMLFHLHTPHSIRIITDFSLAVYFSAYLIGNIVTSYITKRPWMMLTTILYPLYGILESIATAMALRNIKSFHVVKKCKADK